MVELERWKINHHALKVLTKVHGFYQSIETIKNGDEHDKD